LVTGQEILQLSNQEEQFFHQYEIAFQEGDKQKITELVRENQELGQTVAIFLNSKGSQAYRTGDDETALLAFKMSLELCRHLDNREGERAILDNIWMVYKSTGKYQQALQYYQEDLEKQREFGEGRREALLLNKFGSIYRDIGQYQQALNYYQQALEIWQGINDKNGAIVTLNNMGKTYRIIADYQQALVNYQKVLEIAKELEDQRGKAIALNNIGHLLHQYFGEYQQSLNYLQEALSIVKALKLKAVEEHILNNIGQLHADMGNYQEALVNLQKALTISRQLRGIRGTSTSLNNIGTIYRDAGDYQRALRYYREALTISQQTHDETTESVIQEHIGMTYMSLGNYDEASSHIQKALIINQQRGKERERCLMLNNMGVIYMRKGDYQQALNYLQKALPISEQIGDEGLEGTILNHIGVVAIFQNEYEKSMSYLNEALEIKRRIGKKADEGTILSSLGYLYEQQKRWREALSCYKGSIDVLEGIRNKTGLQEMKEAFIVQKIGVYLNTVKLLLKLDSPEEAFTYVEKSKARSFFEQLCEASTGIKRGVDSQLFAEETNLYGKLAVIEQNLKKQINNEQREQLWEKRHALEHELSVLQMELRTSNPRYAELKYSQPATVEQVQQEILKEGEIIVEYLQGDEELSVFIIGKRSFSTHTIEVKAQDLYESITQFLEPLRSTSQEKLNHELAKQLYQILFQPLEQKIVEAIEGEEIKNLIIIPDLLLFYLPFEMLVTKDGETPKYLVDRYPLSYSPSSSVLKPEILHARQPEQYTQDLLALAPFGEEETETTKVALRTAENLLLSDTLRSGLEDVQPLPYSAGEVQTISSLYPQSVCKIGADATKAFLKDHAKGSRYLHLSTHGYLDNEHAMYSGLLFSDGMLQTYEIFNLDIDAELTVLSACETGLGELKAGEGLVGLTRAFMYAGNPSVLVSLWPVSDPSTAAFMKRFYRSLNRGMTKARALQETKLWMKAKSYHTDEHGNVIKHDHPFYWAPFVLVGDWD
jgi:CHAT domain-containing protein/Tfp pilus assembly protein PilF